jgi:hypothetical protein
MYGVKPIAQLHLSSLVMEGTVPWYQLKALLHVGAIQTSIQLFYTISYSYLCCLCTTVNMACTTPLYLLFLGSLLPISRDPFSFTVHHSFKSEATHAVNDDVVQT